MILIPVYEESSPFENFVCSCRRRQQMREETRRRILRHLVDDPLDSLWHHLDSLVMRNTDCKEESSQEKKNTSDIDQKEARKTSEVAVKESFNIQLKTTDFKPDEVTVKVKDGQLTIHAKHEEKKDSGNFLYREMHRNFTIPPDVHPDTIVAEMNKDGLLIIKAERSNGPQEIKPAAETNEDGVSEEVNVQAEENVISEKSVSEASTSTEKETSLGS